MKRPLCLLLLCLSLLTGCAQTAQTALPPETEPVFTGFPDGDPETAACLGSYTGTPDMDAIVARMEDAALTDGELQAWYWAEAAGYRQSQAQPAPDFEKPLDVQSCPLDDSVASWQQYFLQKALDHWHTAHALIRHSQEVPLPTEEAYQFDPEILHKYMDGMPAAQVLYGYNPYYQPNSLHRAWLDGLEDTMNSLAAAHGYANAEAMAETAFGTTLDALLNFAQDWNYAYMYFTTLTYGLEEESAPVTDSRVSLRHILLLPEEGETMADCEQRAMTLLEDWMKDKNASADTFAQLASQTSQDPGSACNGGLYRGVSRQQLPETLARWCFDPSRNDGDTTIIPMDYGFHILYFLGTETEVPSDEAQTALLTQLREESPISIDYSAIVLSEAAGTVSASDLLYPDIAHERFPEVPLYLQQNYPKTMYGEYKITTNGCGITSLAMIASYMTDDELTPPEMCARYGSFSRKTGTDGSLFEKAPPQLGFYLIKKAYDWREARDYMEEGHPVVVVQHKGYWTGGGHYLVLEELSEDGLVRVRDSNLYNYAKLVRHRDDLFPWETLMSGGKGYWIYEKKVTSTPACTRCGDPENLEIPIVSDYLCEKCETALVRRNAYLYGTSL